MPFCLTKLKGGVTAYDITDAIIKNVMDAVNLEKNAYTENKQYFDNAAIDSALHGGLLKSIDVYFVYRQIVIKI